MILELAISLAIGAFLAWKVPKESFPKNQFFIGPFAIAALLLTAAGTATSVQASRRGAKAQREAADLERRKQEATQQRERTKIIADARRKRAEIIQAGVSSGLGTTSSPIQGGAAATQSQGASGVNFLQAQSAFTDSIFAARERRVKAQETGAIGGAVAQVGSNLFSLDAEGLFDKVGADQKPTPAAPTGPLTRNQDIFRTTLFKG